MDLLIIGAAFLSLWEVSLDSLPVIRVFRLVYVTLIFARAVAGLRELLAPASVPYLLGWGYCSSARRGGFLLARAWRAFVLGGGVACLRHRQHCGLR